MEKEYFVDIPETHKGKEEKLEYPHINLLGRPVWADDQEINKEIDTYFSKEKETTITFKLEK